MKDFLARKWHGFVDYFFSFRGCVQQVAFYGILVWLIQLSVEHGYGIERNLAVLLGIAIGVCYVGVIGAAFRASGKEEVLWGQAKKR